MTPGEFALLDRYLRAWAQVDPEGRRELDAWRKLWTGHDTQAAAWARTIAQAAQQRTWATWYARRGHDSTWQHVTIKGQSLDLQAAVCIRVARRHLRAARAMRKAAA